MERIIGVALSRFLAGYIKDFSSDKFKNWSLNDLEFKESVVQQLVGIPPNFEIKKATCNQIYCQIPWSRLGRDPIVLVANTVYVELEEPEVVQAAPVKKPAEKVQPNKKKQGFTERILDNIKFEISELILKIQLLGKDYRLKRTDVLPPAAHIHIKGITVKSTNDKWEVVDLLEVYKMTKKGEVLIYKEVSLESLTMQLQSKNSKHPITLIDNLPIRVKVKKAFFGGPVLFFQAYFALLSQLKLSLHHVQFKQLQDFVDAMMECLYRKPATSGPADATNPAQPIESANIPQTEIEGSTPPRASKSMWSRLTNIIGSYSWYSASNASQPTPEPETSEPEPESSPGDKEDEQSEYVPDEEGTFISDEEDITHTSYSIELARGSIDMWEYVLETTKGLATFEFESLKCEFIPQIERIIDAPAGSAEQQQQKVIQSEVHIEIKSYTLSHLQPGPDRHPDYLKLVEYDPKVASPTTPMLSLHFINRHNGAISVGPNQPPKQRRLDMTCNHVKIVFDIEIWEGIYKFFFGGAKGRRFEQFMEQNIELMLEAALSDYFQFTITTISPTIILPPYAGKFLATPHLSSLVMRMHTGAITLRSVSPSTMPPPQFEGGVFALKNEQFPARPEDFSSAPERERPFSQQKFQLEIDNFSVEVQPTPESAPELVLKPIKLLSHIERREFLKEPKFTPNFETYTYIDRIDFQINQTQYQYFMGVYGERLAWDPHKTTEEMKQILLMEKLLKAADAGATSSEQVATDEPVVEERPAMLVSTKVQIESATIRLLERVASTDVSAPASSAVSTEELQSTHKPVYSTLAELEFEKLQYYLESHPTKNITKVGASKFSVHCPQRKVSPFPYLLSPIESGNSSHSTLLVRYEKKKTQDDTQPAEPAMSWVELNEVQVNWIYVNLARIQLFFSGNEVQPEFREETVRKFLSEYSFSKQEPVAMDWILYMKNSEIVVVESPDSPECAPMQVLNGQLSRRGITKDDIIYEMEGETSFFTKLWRDNDFEREPLTKPFFMHVIYKYQKNKTTDQWTTRMELNINDLDVSISRRQLIMMQNTLDNQLADIRDVSSQRSKAAAEKAKEEAEASKKAYLASAAATQELENSAPSATAQNASGPTFQSEFAINVRKMKLSLKQHNKTFSIVEMNSFKYKTESWTHKWIMLVEASYLAVVAVRDQPEEMSHFATIIQPRKDTVGSEEHSPSANRRAGNLPSRRRRPSKSNKQNFFDMPVVDHLIIEQPPAAKLFSVKLERLYNTQSADGQNSQSPQEYSSRWDVVIAPVRVVYEPEIFAKFKEFFALLEEHKNLRRQYQRIQGDLARLYREQAWLNRDLALKASRQLSVSTEVQQTVQPTTGPLLSLTIENILVLLPEKISDNITSIVELSAERLSVNNDDEAIHQYENFSRADVQIYQARMILRTVETNHEVPLTIQYQEVISPVNIRVIMQTKLNGASGAPFMHVSGEVDVFSARISLKKYQTMVAIANNYVSKFISSIQQPEAVPEADNALAPFEMDAPVVSDNKSSKPFIERIFEVNVKKINLSIVSDYQEELDLFFVQLADVDVMLGMHTTSTVFNSTCRFKVLINDLDYMIPERFIDECRISIKAKMDKQALDEADDPSSSDTVYSTLEIVVLDQLHINVTKELIRHIIEILKLYQAEGSSNKSQSDMHSHFQYVLVNKTEADISYCQLKTTDVKRLPPNTDTVYSFANPYLPKILEVQIAGWAKAEDTIDIEQPGWRCITMKRMLQHSSQTRDVLVRVVPKGLKRYVEFFSTHYVTNETDRPIELLAFKTNISDEDDRADAIEQYDIAPGKRVPISFHASWDMGFALRFDKTWNCSKTFSVSRREGVIKLVISKPNDEQKCVLLVEYFRALTEVEGVNIVNITIAAPFALQNLTPYPLDFEFPMMGGDDRSGQIPANSLKTFYFDPARTPSVLVKLEGYDVWPKPISVEPLGEFTVENRKFPTNVVEDEKGVVNLTVLNTARLQSKTARTMIVSLKYLLVNETDFMLFVKQKSFSSMVYLPPRSMRPFSWQRFGAKQICVNVGNTAWSDPYNLTDGTFAKMVITPRGMKRSYNLLMEVKNLDDFTRVVVWRSWIHLRNRTSRDLYLNQNFEEAIAGTATTASWLSIPKMSTTTSALSPDIFGISLGQDTSEWTIVPLPINKEGTFTLTISKHNRSDEFAIDVTVNQDDKGLYITFDENKDPPYIFVNNTPFLLKIRRIQSTGAAGLQQGETNTAGAAVQLPAEDRTFASILEQVGIFEREVLPIQPHSRLKYYTVGMHKEEESRVDLQVAVFLPEDSGSNSMSSSLEKEVSAASAAVSEPSSGNLPVSDDYITLDDMPITEQTTESESDVILDDSYDDAAGVPLDDDLSDDSDDSEESTEQTGLLKSFHEFNRKKKKIKYSTPVGTPVDTPIMSRHYTPGNSVNADANNKSPYKAQKRGVFSSMKPHKTRLRFQQYFSSTKATWSEQFGIDTNGDFVVKFNRSDNSINETGSSQRQTAVDALHVTVRAQGKTKVITLNLPEYRDGKVTIPAIEQLLKCNVYLPYFTISLRNQRKKELLWTGIKRAQLEYGSFSSQQQFVYLIVGDIEIDNMSKSAEYPVLFSVDKHKLHSFEPNMIELLMEWTIRDDRTFIDFCGLRVLPLIIQIDGKVIDRFYELTSYLNPKEETQIEDEEKSISKIRKQLSEYAQVSASQERMEEGKQASKNEVYLDSIHIYPLVIKLSIGNNSHRWPVISEASLKLQSFRRVQLTHDMQGLVSLLGSSYISQGWAEFYKIIGNLDVIASPLQNAKKIGIGFRDFFVLPVESLVLDDTPGAFVVSIVQGTSSLLLNITDVLFTLLTKTFSSLSWIMQVLTLDGRYATLKVKVYRQHPSNVLYGIGQGVRELGRGIWLGVSGLVLKPLEGATEEGVKGLLKGLGKGIIGLPLKPIAGVFDLFSKSFEGILHSLGRGTVVLQRTHNPEDAIDDDDAEGDLRDESIDDVVYY